jgi:hypothetical protein
MALSKKIAQNEANLEDFFPQKFFVEVVGFLFGCQVAKL